jgi:DNA-binding CsgD family transcriptional regulator
MATSIGSGKARQLSAADAAFSRSDWETARKLYAELATGNAALPGAVLHRWGLSEHRSYAWPEAGRIFEQAYRAFDEEGDHRGAALAASRLVLISEGAGDWPAARGWEQRGFRQLDRVGPCVERGYHALAMVGCDVHDPGQLVERAETALQIAREFKDHELELRALGDKGLGLVCLGRVDEGFALLDEVMAGLVAGEVKDPETRGYTLCAAMSACERTGDSGRAEVWGRAIERDPDLHSSGIVVTHCVIAYGAVEALRGNWEQAETHLERARVARETARYHQASSTARLAELRIRQGRYEEAAELLEGLDDEFEAAQALAALCITQGDLQRASGLLRSFTRGLGSDCIRLAPALAMLVELELKRDDVPAATRATQRLLAVEESCGSNDIRAMARLTSARLAMHAGGHALAIDELETALMLLIHRKRPLLTAQIRLELARALAQAGESASAVVEAKAALGIFHDLGVVPDINASHKLLDELASGGAAIAPEPATPRLRHPPGAVETLTRRESEVAGLVAQGMTNRELAQRLFLSVRTVETHVDRVLGKLGLHTRTQLAAWVQRNS